MKERTIIINGVSKSYAMTGWRIGYAASNKQLAKVMSNYLSHSTGAPSTISQWAAVEALNGPQEGIEAMRKIFEERRNYLVSRLNSIDSVSCITPNGAFYVMMNIESSSAARLAAGSSKTMTTSAWHSWKRDLCPSCLAPASA